MVTKTTKNNIKKVQNEGVNDRVQVQGDVILRKITKLPAAVKPFHAPQGEKVLQQSETTGHHHQFHPTAKVSLFYEGETIEQGVKFITPNHQKYIVVEEESLLYHGKLFTFDPNLDGTGDHKAQTVLPGIYEVDIVREWDYLSAEMRRVVD